jgi:two-component system NtrC family sensor kinase
LKMPRPGLRAEILLSLTLLLAVAMALTSFVILRVTERDLLRYKTADGLAVAHKIQAAVDETRSENGSLDLERVKERLGSVVPWMAHPGLYQEILVLGVDRTVWVGARYLESSAGLRDAQVSSVFATQEPASKLNGEGTLLTITAPIRDGEQCIAAAVIPVPMDEVSERLRKSRLLVWFYVGLNVLVLVVFGNFLLSRIVIKPIKDLVKMADHFEETDLFSVIDQSERNELAHLTVALNGMVKRLAEHKDRLEANIRSLKAANVELKRAREEVIRSEKLSSLGRLAAGVAHEVGNPMGAILGYTNLLKDYVSDKPEAEDYLRRIDQEVTRINAIVRELLDFARPKPLAPAAVDVNELVSESTSFLAGQKLMDAVQVKTRLEDGVGLVWADANQLKQVLINLVLNARDAMSGQGLLSVATRRIVPEMEDREADDPTVELVEIAVSDTGKGVSAEEAKRIFDPFYTTKPPGEGTGLGLAISLRIVEEFGGSIHLESTEGEGSTFAVRLPPYELKDDTERSHH